MTANDKAVIRSKQSWAGFILLGLMVVGGFILAWEEKDVSGYSSVVSIVALAIGGIQGANLFSKPSDDK